MNTVTEYKEKALTGEIINAAYEVHNTLGCGYLEKVYQNALNLELIFRKYKVEREKEIVIRYKNNVVGFYVADLIVESKVIVELKAVEAITSVHQAQIFNYMKATHIDVGLILNFAKPKLEIKRFVF